MITCQLLLNEAQFAAFCKIGLVLDLSTSLACNLFPFCHYQVAAGLAEEEAEAQRLADLEREREKELFKILSKDKRGKKDGRRSKSKSGASPAKAMVSETPTPGI